MCQGDISRVADDFLEKSFSKKSQKFILPI
jgi:hypothetical protein